ncbi:MAG: cytochrome c biogenesis protein CcsA [Muribaculaceae bacterium]|nr:cytochrome c biogenesis protein CcsA [Muribaculaceae bacterium]
MMNSKERILLALCIIAALAVGATAFMPPAVYSSTWWFAFWLAVALGIAFAIIRRRLWRRPTLLMLHVSFLLILAGGAATALGSSRGSIRLVPGVPQASFRAPDGTEHPLPFSVILESFEPEYYPGMTFPRDYHSRIITSDSVRHHISMNNIASVGGWRFYQSSFDSSGASVLTVCHDPWGIALTYTGYILFALAGAAMLFPRRILRLTVLALLAFPAARATAAPAIPQSVADSLRSRSVIFRGRTVPYGEMADMLAYKITGKSTVAGMSPTRFLASLEAFPEQWAQIPFIEVPGRALADSVAGGERYVAPADLYGADGTYLPQRIYGLYDSLDGDILRLDERMALLIELWQGDIYTTAPRQLPQWLTAVHLLWSRVRPWKWFFMLVFASAAALAFWPRRAIPCGVAAIGVLVFVWEWIVCGHIPLASTPGVASFTAVAVCGISATFLPASRPVAFISMLMAGCLALVAWLAARNPVLTPLMPVLASPWLAVHVTLVMLAYAVLGSSTAVSIVALSSPGRRVPLLRVSLRLLAPGTYILALGIFTGAMWANVSWGRYWAWDPKETWALVTLLLYAVPLHPSLGLRARPGAFHIYVLAASMSILMTYFGVNYLPSLHAYK